jgi:O-antigen ligase
MRSLVFFLILVLLVAVEFIGLNPVFLRGLSISNLLLLFVLVSTVVCFIQSARAVPLFGMLLVILIWALVSFLLFENLSGMRVRFVEDLRYFKDSLVAPMVLFCYGYLVSTTAQESKRVVLGILILFSFLNLLAMAQLVTGIQVFTVAAHYVGGGRFTGFGNPNKTAYYLAFLLPLYFFFYRSSPSQLIRQFCFFSIFLAIFSILLTGSRGGIICVAVFLASLLLIFREWKLHVSMLGSALFAIPFLLGSSSFLNKLSGAFERFLLFKTATSAEEVTAYRSVIWDEALTFFGKGEVVAKFIGFGFGSTTYYISIQDMHNWYLKMLFEFGILGLLFSLVFILKFAFFIRKMTSQSNRTYSHLIQVSFFCVFLAFFFSTLSGIFSLFTLTFGAVLALLVSQFYEPVHERT